MDEPVTPSTAAADPRWREIPLVQAGKLAGVFVGEPVEVSARCPRCGRVCMVLHGPQHGLAFEAAVELELTWCSEDGPVSWRLVGPDGATHADP